MVKLDIAVRVGRALVMKRRAVLGIVALLVGCETRQGAVSATSAEGAGSTGVPAPTAETYTFEDNWKGSPCVPKGDVRTLRGRLVVEPFGKGTDGARLEDADGKRWVLTYRAEQPLVGLAGATVEARGRVCDKQGEAIAGPHYDLASVTVVSR